MTNFDKALEAAAQKEFDRWCAEKFSGTPNHWPLKEEIAEHFINWARQFTVDEVLRWMKEDYFKYPDNQVTQAFEERFINQKEQK